MHGAKDLYFRLLSKFAANRNTQSTKCPLRKRGTFCITVRADSIQQVSTKRKCPRRIM